MLLDINGGWGQLQFIIQYKTSAIYLYNGCVTVYCNSFYSTELFKSIEVTR